MAADSEGYTIQAVSRMTGLSIDVIRVWERRYAAVVPERADNGHRRYDDDHVRRLVLLRDAISRGQTISKLAPLRTDEIETLLNETPFSSEQDAATVERLFGHVLAARTAELNDDLTQVMASRPPAEACDRILGPLLERVGDAWENGAISPAFERIASTSIGTVLLSLLKRADRGGSTRLLFATLPGEQHGLGALMSAYAAAEAGMHAVYLGTEVSVDDIVRAVGDLDAAGVAISAVSHPVDADIARLAQRLGDRAKIWVGGRAGATSAHGTYCPTTRAFCASLAG
jgi:DNA-binding transcriptional MerR regulator/methylmalonyl-CoA mutase cobalamin-binding subunit